MVCPITEGSRSVRDHISEPNCGKSMHCGQSGAKRAKLSFNLPTQSTRRKRPPIRAHPRDKTCLVKVRSPFVADCSRRNCFSQAKVRSPPSPSASCRVRCCVLAAKASHRPGWADAWTGTGATGAARVGTDTGLTLASNRNTQIMAALILARVGDYLKSETMADGLAKRFSEDTMIVVIGCRPFARRLPSTLSLLPRIPR